MHQSSQSIHAVSHTCPPHKSPCGASMHEHVCHANHTQPGPASSYLLIIQACDCLSHGAQPCHSTAITAQHKLQTEHTTAGCTRWTRRLCVLSLVGSCTAYHVEFYVLKQRVVPDTAATSEHYTSPQCSPTYVHKVSDHSSVHVESYVLKQICCKGWFQTQQLPVNTTPHPQAPLHMCTPFCICTQILQCPLFLNNSQ